MSGWGKKQLKFACGTNGDATNGATKSVGVRCTFMSFLVDRRVGSSAKDSRRAANDREYGKMSRILQYILHMCVCVCVRMPQNDLSTFVAAAHVCHSGRLIGLR